MKTVVVLSNVQKDTCCHYKCAAILQNVKKTAIVFLKMKKKSWLLKCAKRQLLSSQSPLKWAKMQLMSHNCLKNKVIVLSNWQNYSCCPLKCAKRQLLSFSNLKYVCFLLNVHKDSCCPPKCSKIKKKCFPLKWANRAVILKIIAKSCCPLKCIKKRSFCPP